MKVFKVLAADGDGEPGLGCRGVVSVKTFYNLTSMCLSRPPLALSHLVPIHWSPRVLSGCFAFALAVPSAHHPPRPPSSRSQLRSPRARDRDSSFCLLCLRACVCVCVRARSFNSRGAARGPRCSLLLAGCPVLGLQWRWPTNVGGKEGRGGAPKANRLLCSFAETLGQFPAHAPGDVGAAGHSPADSLPRGVWFGAPPNHVLGGPWRASLRAGPV